MHSKHLSATRCFFFLWYWKISGGEFFCTCNKPGTFEVRDLTQQLGRRNGCYQVTPNPTRTSIFTSQSLENETVHNVTWQCTYPPWATRPYNTITIPITRESTFFDRGKEPLPPLTSLPSLNSWVAYNGLRDRSSLKLEYGKVFFVMCLIF